MTIPERQIRAVFDASTIRVYQAYSDDIADSALARGTFVSPPFGFDRMTWIKPSFLWMMYRAGWGEKDDRQKRVLAIDIMRDGFEWALAHSELSHYHAVDGQTHDQWRQRLRDTPVRIQWDPERNLQLEPLPHRAIQIGLKGEAVEKYVNGWIARITEVTALATTIRDLVQRGEEQRAAELLPVESPYPLSGEIGSRIHAS